MKIHIEVKDIVVYALIILLAATMFVKFAKIEAALQTTALVKTVNDQGTAIQQIIKFLNEKTAGAKATTKVPVQEKIPEIK